ncbi:hypothetical protein [Anaerobacillus alkaliphilus]|nr:hypothetical protein [Anaerobacillus alkaliphilus]
MDHKVSKSIVKTIRYIKQDATDDQLDTIKRLVIEAIERRKQLLSKT